VQTAPDSDLSSRLAAILESLPEVELAYLFGSHAAGRARPESDIDLGVQVAAGAAEQPQVERAEALEGGWRDWLRFEETCQPHLKGWRKEAAARSIAMLRIDQGRNFGFCRVVAAKS
jgi:predicted nucleotidyltransferase